MFLFPRITAAITVAGVLAPATSAFALWDDQLELFVGQYITRDDNVFRLPSAVDPAPILGSSSTADTYHTTSAGLNFDVPLSAQRFVGDLTLNKYRLDRFRTLNLDGHDGRALWFWQAADRLGGQLGYTESLTIASLSNLQSGVQNSTANFFKVQETVFNAAYQPTARWQIRGDLSRLEHSHSAAELQLSDASIDGIELTAAYATRADNHLGLSITAVDGRLPNRQLVAGLPIDNSYQQQSIAAFVRWTMSGHSRVTARAGRISRSYTQLPQRDFEGSTFHATYEWQPTEKLMFAASAQKDISTAEQVNIGFVLVKGFTLSSTLKLTEKVDLSARLDDADRDYLGDPRLVPGAVPSPAERIQERVRVAGLTVSYRPTRPLTLTFAWRRESRSSNQAFLDYEANIASLGARIGF